MPSGVDGATTHAREAVRVRERRARDRVVPGEVDAPLGLAGQAQRPALGSAHEHRGLAALPQSAQERLGPEVLVDVGRAAQGGAG